MARLASMTGYARARGSASGISFTCEVKSVNGRGLDMRLRLAPGTDALEPELRRRIGKALSRGSVTFSLTLERDAVGGDIVINRQALGTVLATLQMLSTQIEGAPPRLDGILNVKGVVEQRDNAIGEDEEAVLHEAVLAAADSAIADLVAARDREGAELAVVLNGRIEEMAALVERAETHPSRSREAILARLRAQIGELVAAEPALPEERLAQEALLLTTKADIREELDRLTAHLVSARKLIADGGPVGRRLDFLSQEFNREANTLCAKANAVELTTIGLDLKAVIDQFREQVQNIE
jgi:uncharacterized protein (TIGR00255 family)